MDSKTFSFEDNGELVKLIDERIANVLQQLTLQDKLSLSRHEEILEKIELLSRATAPKTRASPSKVAQKAKPIMEREKFPNRLQYFKYIFKAEPDVYDLYMNKYGEIIRKIVYGTTDEVPQKNLEKEASECWKLIRANKKVSLQYDGYYDEKKDEFERHKSANSPSAQNNVDIEPDSEESEEVKTPAKKPKVPVKAPKNVKAKKVAEVESSESEDESVFESGSESESESDRAPSKKNFKKF